MTREIKFRAWCPTYKTMYYSESTDGNHDWLSNEGTCWTLFNWSLDELKRRKIELMQFTELTDKNGKEIYDMDIVKKGNINYLIEWRIGMWGIYTRHYGWGPLSEWKNHEIIGNIYENSKLLT